MFVHRRLSFRYADGAIGDVIVDVLLDDRRRRINKVVTSGWWGRLKSNEVWPFILTTDNRLDFGSSDDAPTPQRERYAEINFADRIIAEGEVFILTYQGERWNLLLERVIDLAEAV